MDEADLLLRLAKRLHHSVDSISGQAKDRINAPVNQFLNKHIGCSHPLLLIEAALGL